MIRLAIATRYAKALFQLDLTSDTLKDSLENFQVVLQLLKDNPKWASILHSPLISLEERKKFLSQVLKDKVKPRFLSFLNYILEKGRQAYLVEISNEYRKFFDEKLKIWEAVLITAVPIDQEIKVHLQDMLKNFYRKTIIIKEEINPRIIGGAKLRVANQMIDWSITERLRKLKENLLASNGIKELG